jgi:long-chain acyl-CoA synthetase
MAPLGCAAVSVAATLHAAAARRPEQAALRVAAGGTVATSLTFAELDTAMRRGAAALGALGLTPGSPPGEATPDAAEVVGDRVVVLCPSGALFVEALYAVWAAGLVAVPVNPASVARELAAVLADVDAGAVIVHRDLMAVVDQAGDAVAAPPPVLVVDDDTGVAQAVDSAARPLAAPVDGDPEQLALLQYTAGTTGRPKGAMLRHRNLLANHRQLTATKLHVDGDDRVLCVLPLSHIYALNVALAYPLACGASVVIAPRFDAAESLALIAEQGVSGLLAAPPMLAMWAQASGVDELDLSRVRFAVSGAAPLSPSVLRRFYHRWGVPVYEGYGLTETAPVLTTTAVTGDTRPGSVGHPLPEVELRLLGEDGQPVRRGDPGEVWARGPNVFAGYWRDPTETARALRDGWLATGDVGYEQDEALHLVDRKRDLVIVSGFNVYPREVEDVLTAHPKVADAAVVGVPDPTTGEAVKALVQPVPGEAPTAAELAAHCDGQLARFKIPAQVAIVDELPVGPAGKVMRAMLRG